MLHVLRRTNPQQSSQNGETGLISCQAFRHFVNFVTVLIFLINYDYLRAGLGTYVKRHRPFADHASEGLGERIRGILVHIVALKKFSSILQLFFSLQTLEIICMYNRGEKPREKCPIQIADLVLLHNHIMEALS